MNEQTQYTMKGQAVEASSRKKSPAGGRGELILAMLPFLLILLADSLPKLLVISGFTTFKEAGFRILNTGLLIVLTGTLLAVFILAVHRKWPIWSATWVLFFCIPPLVLAVGLANWLMQGQLDFTISQDVVVYFWIPLVIAILLYAVTRLDPLRGLLAALPVIYLLWQPNMEFVPDPIELAIKVLSILLICLTIVFILRRGDWRTGLYVILGVNLAVGALFAYAGIYHGGALPFEAAGPNLVEVARSLIPQYLATSAILLGPLFAWRFRQLGRSNSRGGIIAYHIALAGLILVIMVNLAGLSLTMQVNRLSDASNAMTPLVLLGLGVYLVGVVWLYRYWTIPRTFYSWAEGILLPLLPLGIPVALMLPFITWRWPVSNLYGIPLLWVLPHAVSLSIGLVWLGLSVWVIVRHGEDVEPLAVAGPSAQTYPGESQPEDPDRSADLPQMSDVT